MHGSTATAQPFPAMPVARLSGNGSASDTRVGEPGLEVLRRFGAHHNGHPRLWTLVAGE
jgi:hypothetical protein